jgi:hypothetical protein
MVKCMKNNGEKQQTVKIDETVECLTGKYHVNWTFQ